MSSTGYIQTKSALVFVQRLLYNTQVYLLIKSYGESNYTMKQDVYSTTQSLFSTTKSPARKIKQKMAHLID